MITILSVLVLDILVQVTSAATITSTQLLNPTQEAALADYPLVSAFVSNLGVSTGYLLQDYQSYATAASTQIPAEVLNYFQIIEAVSDYQELQSQMIKTFPFQGFQSFITIFPWYSTLLQEAQMTTYYLPKDFVSSTASDASIQIVSSVSFSSPSAINAVSSTVYPTASSTQSAHSNTENTVSSAATFLSSTVSSSATQNESLQSAFPSTKTPSSSKASNQAIKTMQVESFSVLAFLLALVFAI
ncbi:hypothetical protein ACO0QE_001323 [Hanseniaspora vineae]